MNGLARLGRRARQDRGRARQSLAGKVDLMVCPPATLLCTLRRGRARARAVAIGGQDCHAEPSGAFTGDISAEMLADAGRNGRHRRPFGAADLSQGDRRAGARQGARRLARGADRDRLHRRDQGRAGGRARRSTCSAAQLAGSLPDGATGGNLVIAYEPVWAIGTGLTPTAADVAEVHGFIRERLDGALWRRPARRSASSTAAR